MSESVAAPQGFRGKIHHFREKHETKMEVAFFIGGFIFDAWATGEPDEWLSIVQAIGYLIIIGTILYYDFMVEHGRMQPPGWLAKVWKIRHPAMHFALGSLLNMFSLFFIKSSSVFSTAIFVVVLLAVVIANELRFVREARLNLKFALWMICLTSFFLVMFPTFLGAVGYVPFALSMLVSFVCLIYVKRFLDKRFDDKKLLRNQIWFPGLGVIVAFTGFYFMGLIPPVPLAVKKMGIYHLIEKSPEGYALHHERPPWKIWQTGDQEFKAEPGDQIHVFVRVFSPARFDDELVLHWMHKDARLGWKTHDRIKMRVVGGRQEGFRGWARKQNYTDGDWRISVETTDQREIGRIYFNVARVEKNPARVFETELE